MAAKYSKSELVLVTWPVYGRGSPPRIVGQERRKAMVLTEKEGGRRVVLTDRSAESLCSGAVEVKAMVVPKGTGADPTEAAQAAITEYCNCPAETREAHGVRTMVSCLDFGAELRKAYAGA